MYRKDRYTGSVKKVGNKMKNPYESIPAVIEDIITETSAIKTFVIRPEEEISFTTGQFVELSMPGIGEAPFTPSSNPYIKNKMEITIMNAGRVTKLFHESKSNTKVGIRGPYGKGYPLKEFEGKDIAIIGGGVGLAPLRSLLLALFNEIDRYNKIVVRYGAKTPKDIVYKSSIPEWAKKDKVDFVTTVDLGDETWKGNVGIVTTIVKDLPVDLNNSVSIVCGPPIMMKFTTFKLLDIGYHPKDIYLSMEKNMSCGIGKCGHCRIDKFYVCQHGPVFKYEQIKDAHELWD